MLYFLLASPDDLDHVTAVEDESKNGPRPPGQRPFTGEDGTPPNPKCVQSRWDWKTYQDAARVALAATEWSKSQPRGPEDTPDVYIPVDQGSGRSPRFDVIRLHKVGDPVSYGFNGDCYPDGYVSRISAGPVYLRIETTGHGGHKRHVYYRRNETGSWIQQGGTFSLVRGHITKVNQER